MVNINHLKRPSVYALHAGDFRFAYVGTTTVNSKNRLYQHIHRARSGHPSPVYASMRDAGLGNVEVVDLEQLNFDNIHPADAAVREAHWIRTLIERGHPIVNRLGRNGVPNSHSPESRALVSKANRGRATWNTGLTGEAAGWTEERRRNHGKTRQAQPA